MTDFVFLDSGTGGIPYLLYLKEKYPTFTCAYLGDTKNFPYGEKSVKEIISSASNAVELIIEKWNPKAIVIACNTMSVTALDALRIRFPKVPFVGTVPAIKLAAKITKNKRIGLLATRQAVSNEYTEKLISEFASDCVVVKRGDPELIDFIETKLFTASESEKIAAVTPAIEYFQKESVDTIILGCTHFLHIKECIQSVAGKNVNVVDSREGVAKQALRIFNEIEKKHLLQKENSVDESVDMSFYITGYPKNREQDSTDKEYSLLCDKLKLRYAGII